MESWSESLPEYRFIRYISNVVAVSYNLFLTNFLLFTKLINERFLSAIKFVLKPVLKNLL